MNETEMTQVIDFDKLGHCVKCHCEIGTEQVFKSETGNELKAIVWSERKKEVQFELNDGSKMKVFICKDCLASLDKYEYPSVMESVKRGWWHELEHSQWSFDKKVKYIQDYSKLEIEGVV